jgi:hypothetical protein
VTWDVFNAMSSNRNAFNCKESDLASMLRGAHHKVDGNRSILSKRLADEVDQSMWPTPYDLHAAKVELKPNAKPPTTMLLTAGNQKHAGLNTRSVVITSLIFFDAHVSKSWTQHT